MIGLGTLTMSAQSKIGNATSDSKIAEFTKLVNSYTSGQRVGQAKLKTIYHEINCELTETQANTLDIGLADSREDICGSSEFPRTQVVTDSGFKKYSESVHKYLSYIK